MKNNQFDRIIREKLSRLNPAYRPETWQSLEDQLDAEAVDLSSANGDFDRIISRKVEDLHPAFQPESWDWLEQKLDAEETAGVPEPEAKVIDETIFSKLHRLEVSYNPNSWKRMAQLLDQEFIYARQVILYKATELLLVALALFTLWPYLAVTEKQVEPTANSPVAATPIVAPATAEQGEAAPDLTTITGSSNWLTGTIRPSLPVFRPVNNLEIWFDLPVAPAEATITYLPPAASQSMSPLTNLTGELAREAENANALRKLLFDSPAPFSPQSLETAMLAAIDPSTAPALAPQQQKRPEAIQGLRTGRKNDFINFGMFGSLDYNRIITPPDRFLDVEVGEFDRYALGYSGGFSLGFEFDRWEIQTGLIYTAKHYQPLQVLFLAGRFDEGYIKEILKDIELNIINIPLNFKYNLFHQDKWRVYALAGASVQVAVQANYYVSSQSTFRSARPSNPDRNSFYDQGFEGGWLEGGSFRENSYITGNLGFGVERFVTTQWSIFAQPTYQHAIGLFNQQGLGPTMDRINTMSLYTGIRIRLRR